MGLSTLRTQVMTIPAYACAAVATFVLGYVSDRWTKRCLTLIIAFLLAAIGWLLLLTDTPLGVRFLGTCFIAMGAYPSVILTLTWANTNIIGYTKR